MLKYLFLYFVIQFRKNQGLIMAGILGYLAALADDISSIAGKTMATATRAAATSLDDMTLMVDDIATYTKIASVKSSGVVIDDLAAISNMTNETTSDILKKELSKATSLEELKNNISHLDEKEKKIIFQEMQQLHNTIVANAKSTAAKRELPIVWKIAKGSTKNKLIIIPLILLIDGFLPWLMMPILIAGGLFLAYEGAHSVLEKLHPHESEDDNSHHSMGDDFENDKVASAVKTDFVLSLEIMVIALSMVAKATLGVKIGVLLAVAIIATVGVYGIVALIVKLDDIGFFLQANKKRLIQKIGDGIVASVPSILGAIGIIGTVAMLGVGGGIVEHQFGLLHIAKDKFDITLHWIFTLLIQVAFGMVLGLGVIKALPWLLPIAQWVTSRYKKYTMDSRAR